MGRSTKKGPWVQERLMQRINRMNESGEKRIVNTWARASTVFPEMVGHTIGVHDGRRHVPVFISESMVGHKLGESAKPKRAPRAGAKRGGDKAAEKKPAARARRRSEPEPPRPVVRAQAKYVRSSARKARLVIEHLRGKSIEDARAVLRHTPRAIARELEKLLDSAVANAENNHELVGDDLVVKDVFADEGPTIRRFRPRARGRATRIR